MAVTNQNCTEEEFKRRLILGNACYHSIDILLSSHLLSKNVKFRIYKTVLFPAILYGCEFRSLVLRKEHRLRTSENRVLRRIFAPNRYEVRENLITRSFTTCMLCQI
jgi:hypothetical protein